MNTSPHPPLKKGTLVCIFKYRICELITYKNHSKTVMNKMNLNLFGMHIIFHVAQKTRCKTFLNSFYTNLAVIKFPNYGNSKEMLRY